MASSLHAIEQTQLRRRRRTRRKIDVHTGPYVESLAKKATAAVVALILGFLTHRGYRIPQLASLALISCAVLALVGMQLRSRYLAAMRRRVARRSVARSSTTFLAVWKSTRELGYGDNIASKFDFHPGS